MSLPVDLVQRLEAALLGAFPDDDALDRLIRRVELQGWVLSRAALVTRVDKLIQVVDAHGRVRDLLDAALELAPGNVALSQAQPVILEQLDQAQAPPTRAVVHPAATSMPARSSAEAQALSEPVRRTPTAQDANSDRPDRRTASGSSPPLRLDAETYIGVQAIREIEAAANPPRLRVPLFHYGGVVPPSYFIGRAEELELAEQLVRSRQSFLLVGERRSGKTSFCEALIHGLMGRPENDVLVGKLNLESCQNLTVASFLGHTLLNLFGEIARQVFGCHYSTLLLAKSAAKERLSQDPAFVSLLDLHRFIIERIRAGQDTSDSLLPNEFIAFCAELLDLIATRGWRSCAMIYDEANHLAKDLSIDLLMNNMEALSSAMIVTVYAASPVMAASFGALSAYLPRRVPIGPFKSHIEMRQLLARYYHNDPNRLSDLPITNDAQELTWKISKGTPFRIQCIFAFAFGHARQQEAHLITTEHISQALADLRQELPQYFNSL